MSRQSLRFLCCFEDRVERLPRHSVAPVNMPADYGELEHLHPVLTHVHGREGADLGRGPPRIHHCLALRYEEEGRGNHSNGDSLRPVLSHVHVVPCCIPSREGVNMERGLPKLYHCLVLQPEDEGRGNHSKDPKRDGHDIALRP